MFRIFEKDCFQQNMLAELSVENFAVVEQQRIRFHEGLNLLTGETGSGKSIVVDAVGLLLGGRASSEIVRTGADRARVMGIFTLPASAALRQKLEEAGIPVEENELIVEREVAASGKSRAFAGNRPVTLALLKELAPWLGDIHGQNEQQRLYEPSEQREMLDNFAGLAEERKQVAACYASLTACAAELEELTRKEQEQLRLADLWNFQRKEIEAVAPKPGEEEELQMEKRRLQNVGRLSDLAQAAYAALYDSPEAALGRAQVAAKKVAELVRIDESLKEVADLLEPALIGLEEASRTLEHYLEKLEADPARLDEVENRLANVEKLKRKYGPTVEEVITFLAELQAKMHTVETADEQRQKIAERQQKLEAEFRTLSASLTAKRKTAAKRLERNVEKDLAGLAMASAKFRVVIDPGEWSASGADAVRFRISANAGEEPRELERVASGGEVSRIALAIKTCIERERSEANKATGAIHSSGNQRLLVFDEVDAGIGGDAAESVGRKLKELSRANQILCVTHQATIASFADHHYRVEKLETKGRTQAITRELTGEERVKEIGRMLSGQRLTPEAIKHAEQLLASS